MSKTEVHIVHTALPDMVKVGSDASHVEESKQGQDVIDQETARRPDLATILAIGFMGLSTVAPIACGFIVATSILVNIGNALDGTDQIAWIVTSWSIASSVSFSLAGSLSDIFGRRYVILCGQLTSLVGAVIAGVANSVSMVIGGSALLGLSCGLVLVAYAAIPELLPNRYRNIGLAWTEITLHIPWAALAVLLGNLFILHATWRWVYYISIIYAAVSLIGTAIFYFPPARPNLDTRSRWQELKELDYIGMLLYTGGLTSFLLGISWAGSDHPWRSVAVILPIVIGVISFAMTFVYDFVIRDQTKHRLFPKELLIRYREYTVTLIVLFVSGMVYYSMSALLPQATIFVYTSDPIQVGITLLPNGLGQATGACIITMFIHLTKRPKWYVLCALIVQTLFAGLYAYGISGNRAAWMAFGFFGQGCFALITVSTVLNAGLHVDPKELGIAIGLLGTFRSLGGSVGNTIFGTILRSTFDEELPRRIVSAATTYGYDGSISELIGATIQAGYGVPMAFNQIPDVTPALEALCLGAFRSSYQEAFRMVFYSTIPFGVVAIIAAVFIKDASHHMTAHTQVFMQKNVLQSISRRTRQTEKQ